MCMSDFPSVSVNIGRSLGINTLYCVADHIPWKGGIYKSVIHMQRNFNSKGKFCLLKSRNKEKSFNQMKIRTYLNNKTEFMYNLQIF